MNEGDEGGKNERRGEKKEEQRWKREGVNYI
jgi:hypothetical protein